MNACPPIGSLVKFMHGMNIHDTTGSVVYPTNDFYKVVVTSVVNLNASDTYNPFHLQLGLVNIVNGSKILITDQYGTFDSVIEKLILDPNPKMIQALYGEV